MELHKKAKQPIGLLATEFCSMLLVGLAFNLDGDTKMWPLILYPTSLIAYRISGAHVNPAVTIGVYCEREDYITDFYYFIMIFLV